MNIYLFRLNNLVLKLSTQTHTHTGPISRKIFCNSLMCVIKTKYSTIQQYVCIIFQEFIHHQLCHNVSIFPYYANVLWLPSILQHI